MSSAAPRWQAAFDQLGSTRAAAVYRLVFVASLLVYSVLELHPGRMPDPRHLQLVAGALMVASGAAFVGWRTRTASIVMTASFAYLYFTFGAQRSGLKVMQYQQALQGLVVLCLLPAGRSLSLDRCFEARRADDGGRLRPEQGSLWASWLAVVSLSVMYVDVARSMLEPAWLSGFELEQTYIARWGSSDSIGLRGGVVHATSVVVAWSGLIWTSALAVGVWLRRWWRFVVPAGLALHGLVWIGVGGWPFTTSVMCLYVLLLPPEVWERAIDGVLGLEGRPIDETSPRGGDEGIAEMG